MSKFLTELDVKESQDGWWTLCAPLVFQSDVVGKEVKVPRGFHTDFASVPRLPFAYLLFGGTANRPAAVHDWLYLTADFDRKTCDRVFLEACLADGVPRWKAQAMYTGVRLFGGGRYGKVAKV